MHFQPNNPNHIDEFRRQLERAASPQDAEHMVRQITRSIQGRKVVAAAMGARAYAESSQLHLNLPRGVTECTEGLLGHELTHVEQSQVRH